MNPMVLWENTILSPPVIHFNGVLRKHHSHPLWFDSNSILREKLSQTPCDMTPLVFLKSTILSTPFDLTPMVLWENTILSPTCDWIWMVFWENTVFNSPVIWIQWCSERTPFSFPHESWHKSCSDSLIEEAVFSPLYIFASFSKDKLTICALVYLWALYPVLLNYISVSVPVPYCLDCCSFVV